MTGTCKWLFLVYKIPSEPSRYRVAIWRRLKEAGSIYLQNSVCLLPDTPANREFFQSLAREIHEAQGESWLLLAEALDLQVQEKVVERFNAERDGEYGEFIEQGEAFLEEIRRETGRQNFTFGELEENEESLRRLESWLNKIKNRDFFKAAKAAEAQEYLARCQESLEAFAAKVFFANEGSREQ